DTGPLVSPFGKRRQPRPRPADLCGMRTSVAIVRGGGHRSLFPDGKGGSVRSRRNYCLGRRGVYQVSLHIDNHWAAIEALLKKYADRPTSLADASLIRCAEIHQEPRIATFESDFGVYRWGRHKRFEIL